MAMYYYASKLSAVACGTRCRQGLARRQRTNRTNRQGGKKDDDEDSDDNSKDKKALSSFFCESTNDTIVISVKSSEQPEVCCESTPTLAQQHSQGSLGTGGVMYGNGTIVSGPLESLIDLLMPGNVEEFDQVREASSNSILSLFIHGPTVACIQCSRQTCVIVRAWKSNCASFAFSSFINSLLLPSLSLSLSVYFSPHVKHRSTSFRSCCRPDFSSARSSCSESCWNRYRSRNRSSALCRCSASGRACSRTTFATSA
uniref:Uncharacterized protein n=1 Tax=Anopheles merus TaxID=30066 RepID=A0A182UNX0_ANOME